MFALLTTAKGELQIIYVVLIDILVKSYCILTHFITVVVYTGNFPYVVITMNVG